MLLEALDLKELESQRLLIEVLIVEIEEIVPVCYNMLKVGPYASI